MNYCHHLSKNARKVTVLCCGGLEFWAMMLAVFLFAELASGTNAKENPNNIAPGQ